MTSRQEQLSELQNYIKEVDKEVTMILQSLQWDRKRLLQSKPKSTCKYDINHKILPEKLEEHETKCVLKSQGYADDDIFLPDVLDANSNTVLKLSSENIKDIINYAAKTDPVFFRGEADVASVPQTTERLQATYTADERRAIYNAVIHSRPSCEQLADLALGEVGGSSQSAHKGKSKLEQLSELRDMRRRRAKYKVAVRSHNYSHALRGLIDTQMEMYTEVLGQTMSKSDDKSFNKNLNVQEERTDEHLGKASNKIAHHRELDKSRKDKYYNEDERNNHSNNKRKRDHYDDKISPKFEKDRYQSSKGERRNHDEYGENKRRERKRENYRGVVNDQHKPSTEKIKYNSYRTYERNTRETNRVHTDECQISSEDRDREKHYNIDRRQDRKGDTYYIEKSNSRKYDKNITNIKEEKDISSTYSRDRQRYSDSKIKKNRSSEKDKYQTSAEDREERYYSNRRGERKRVSYSEGMYDRKYDKSLNIEKDRTYIKEEKH